MVTGQEEHSAIDTSQIDMVQFEESKSKLEAIMSTDGQSISLSMPGIDGTKTVSKSIKI